ncbi:putative Ufm1-specific protease 2 [Blattamonas nauphoetae]|uniref:Ufm1-specific protease 2 n=1 Tax=Blattamonas nauphoetae TaxID=2049346 RepID=A0ABQ9YM54_9EUKA|nr:putative Ufm1-specific protease 2 [Blattamonas nauphoetae]
MTKVILSDLVVTTLQQNLKSVQVYVGCRPESTPLPLFEETVVSISFEVKTPINSAVQQLQFIQNLLPTGFSVIGLHWNADDVSQKDKNTFSTSFSKAFNYSPLIGITTVSGDQMKIDFTIDGQSPQLTVKPRLEIDSSILFIHLSIPAGTAISSNSTAFCFQNNVSLDYDPVHFSNFNFSRDQSQTNINFVFSPTYLSSSVESLPFSSLLPSRLCNSFINDEVGVIELTIATMLDDDISDDPIPVQTSSSPFDLVVAVNQTQTVHEIARSLLGSLEANVHSKNKHRMFRIPGFSFPLVIQEQTATKSTFAKIHTLFALPPRPFFSSSFTLTKHSLSPTPPPAGRLSCVHTALYGMEGLKVVKSASVSEKYDYFHYNQDNDNDAGWGCAYRSLQTIQSFFKHLGEKRDPLSLSDIQDTLIEMGDKPEKFKEERSPWIGSIEVSFVLENWGDIESKIINMQSGSEFDSHFSELFDHFRTQGTPIMIGGGVLAYTLLGIRQVITKQSPTPTIEYLILDPHFKGGERITDIINEKWVWWHPASIFRTDCHYNMCLPQRKDTTKDS